MAHTPKLRHVDPYRRRGRLYLAVCRFSATKAGAWLSVNVAWKGDPLLLKLTRGRFSTAAPVAAALLEARGARTGRPRRNATLYFHDSHGETAETGETKTRSSGALLRFTATHQTFAAKL